MLFKNKSAFLMVILVACSPTTQSATSPNVQPIEEKEGSKKKKKITDVHDHGEDLGDGDKVADDQSSKVNTPPAPVTPPETAPAPSGGDPNIVEFTIRAGTGRGAWNTPQTPIRAKVGQTLVIKNEDSTNHWVHTNFGPFFHPVSGIPPGQSVRYRINSPNAQGMRDHLSGGAIYMEVSR